MLRKSIFWSVVIICTVLGGFASAQNQPSDQYECSGLYGGVVNTPMGLYVQDFLTSYVNVNSYSITIQTSLIADDSNYVYLNSEQGTYHFEDIDIEPLSISALNFFGIAFYGAWEGTMVAEANSGNAFYIFKPNDASVASGLTNSVCNAYYNAWQSGSWSVPFFWDETAGVLVTPYANFWHNDNFWDKGWNSHITITNNGSQSVTYTVHYVSWHSRDIIVYDPASNCSETNLGDDLTLQVGPLAAYGGSWSGSLEEIINANSNKVVAEDGFIYIETSPTIGGTYPVHNLSPNASGVAGPANCRSNGCFLN